MMMQKISAIVSNPNILTAKVKEEQKTLDPATVQLVDRLFVKMGILCRGFDSFYADRNRLNAEKTQWVLAFTKHGIGDKSKIKHALNKLELHKYPNPPQLGEFLAWCNPSAEDLGFPCVDTAYVISVQMNAQFSDYAHEDDRVDAVIRHAIKQIGTFIYREMKISDAKKAFKTYYMIALKHFLNGELKAIPKALPEKANPHPSDKGRADEARKRCMDELRSKLAIC